MRRRVMLILCLAIAGVAPLPASASVIKEPISFSVENPMDPGTTYTVRGSLFRPASEGATCGRSVMLLQHGLSYGEWGWDFPMVTATEYSVARALARAGFHAVAIDRLGYGSSDRPNGYTLTVEGYAAMTDQMVTDLRARGYDHVGLMGHSAGTEASEFAQAIFGSADLLVATAYHQFPSDRIVIDFITGDTVRAAQDDREYFGADPAQRLEYMYNEALAEEAVMRKDNDLADTTPSGEIWTIGVQPSRYVIAAIDVPVLLVLAENDLLFPVERAAEAAAMFASAPDVTTHIVPGAGHSYMLHTNAAASNAAVIDWLDDRMAVCA